MAKRITCLELQGFVGSFTGNREERVWSRSVIALCPIEEFAILGDGLITAGPFSAEIFDPGIREIPVRQDFHHSALVGLDQAHFDPWDFDSWGRGGLQFNRQSKRCFEYDQARKSHFQHEFLLSQWIPLGWPAVSG